jgi:hypothetical protein
VAVLLRLARGRCPPPFPRRPLAFTFPASRYEQPSGGKDFLKISTSLLAVSAGRPWVPLIDQGQREREESRWQKVTYM